MADPTIKIRLIDDGASGGPGAPMPGGGFYPVPGRGVGLPMPGKGDGQTTLASLLGLTPGMMGMIKGGLLGMGVKLSGGALSNMGADLSKYSPELSMAKANSDIRNMQSEMNRAQTLGPNLAKFERRWNEMMNQFYEKRAA